jgi:hypothetical protein
MRMPLLILKVLLVTVVAVAAAWYAITSVNISGLIATNFTAAEVIKERCPIHLVRPEWITSRDQTDMLFNWPITEMKARLAVLLVLWALSVAVLAHQHARRQRHDTK